MSTEKQKITLTCEVDSYRSGWTIVRFLAHRFKYHTAERWTKRVADGWVLVNGARVTPDHDGEKRATSSPTRSFTPNPRWIFDTR